jgi:CBS domain-containing protein
MKVAEIMSVPVVTSTPETSLAQAARLMQSADVGILPVVDSDGGVVGIITDRDICLAIAASNRSPRAIAVHEVMAKYPVVAREDDELSAALSAMRHGRVRRLPVLDRAARLTGMLSLDDIVSADEIVNALRDMYERRPALVEPVPVSARV